MKPKRRRLLIVVIAMLTLGGVTALTLTALEDGVVFFFSPSELLAQETPSERAIRVGGLVEEGSVVRGFDDARVEFRVTDTARSLPVRYRGLLPDLFREGQGVVVHGRLGADGVFEANEVLAKHDETYMPREVADALKRAGHWQDEGS